MCDECMMIYDGDRFRNEMLPEDYLNYQEDEEEEA